MCEQFGKGRRETTHYFPREKNCEGECGGEDGGRNILVLLITLAALRWWSLISNGPREPLGSQLWNTQVCFSSSFTHLLSMTGLYPFLSLQTSNTSSPSVSEAETACFLTEKTEAMGKGFDIVPPPRLLTYRYVCPYSPPALLWLWINSWPPSGGQALHLCGRSHPSCQLKNTTSTIVSSLPCIFNFPLSTESFTSAHKNARS